MLRLDCVSKAFGAKIAVDNVSFDVPRGQFLGIIGRSGAGKSTLLRMINRLTTPTSGRIYADERDVTALTGASLRDWRQANAMIFQQFNLVGRLDVLTNVLLGRLNHTSSVRSIARLWSREDRAIAISALEQLDIAPLAAQRAETLSGGQQQRVAIARALVQQPSLILADEPIASLDPRNTRIVMDALQRINKQLGITILCNLHSLDTARTYSDRLLGMTEGRVVFDGAPSVLDDDTVRSLYGLEAGEVVDTAGTAMPQRRHGAVATPVAA